MFNRYIRRYMEIFGESPFDEKDEESGEEEEEEMKESERI